MTNEESLLQKFDMEAETNRLLANEDEDDLNKINADCEEFDRLSKEVEAEREQWEYGHGEGILDALEALLSFRENMQSDVLLAMIQKVTKRKLFDPPF
jgi:hypothetical protein